MPVISFPCVVDDDYSDWTRGREVLASALTDSCTAIVLGSVYHLPHWNRNGKHLTSAEFTALIQEPGVFGRAVQIGNQRSGICIRNIRIPIAPEWDIFKFWSPRIAWLANYERIKRHTAFAMARHPRLGEGCGLLRVLHDDVIRAVIVQTFQHNEEDAVHN